MACDAIENIILETNMGCDGIPYRHSFNKGYRRSNFTTRPRGFEPKSATLKTAVLPLN